MQEVDFLQFIVENIVTHKEDIKIENSNKLIIRNSI